MSQWIKRLSLPALYVSFLLVWLYYSIYTGNLLAWLGFALLILRLVLTYTRKQVCGVLLVLALFAGWFSYQNYQSQVNMQRDHAAVDHILILPDTIKVNGDSLSFRGKANGQLYQAYYKLKTEQEKQAFQGVTNLTTLTIEGELSLPEGQRNFKGFDYAAYLKTQGIYRTLKIDSIQAAQETHTWNLWDNLSMWRRKALVWIKSNFPAPMNNYMTGLLFGYLDTDFEEMNGLYSSLGIIHLFALSGMQVGFFMDAFRKLFLRAGVTVEVVKWLSYPFALVYAGLTGFSVSVVRSLVQKILAQHGITKLDNFALTIMVLSLLMPQFLLTAGGVLSCAYAFILTMTNFDGLSGVKKFTAESLVISLGILPILSFYFGEFQPWSILLTFVFSLVFDVVMLPGLSLLFLVSPILKITQVNFLFDWLENIIRWVAGISSRPIVFGQPDSWVLLAMLFLLGILYDVRKKHKTFCVVAVLLASLFFITKHPLENEITVVDIGQGDSIFLRDVKGKKALIDVGGRVEIGKKEPWQQKVASPNASRTLIPYLKSRGVSSLDVLVLTHTDTDHMGDMLEVAQHFAIKQVYVSKGSLTQPDFVQKLEQLGTAVHAVAVGDTIPIFDSQLEVLYPSSTGDGGNDDSIVLYGKFFNTSFLFTGDLEEQGEGELLEKFPNLQVDVLKAGHHGSKGSSSPAFLAQVQPKISLISAGKNNRYKHPHQETLDRLQAVNSQVYRTDEQGAIRFKGWNSWQIETVRE